MFRHESDNYLRTSFIETLINKNKLVGNIESNAVRTKPNLKKAYNF